MLPSGTSDWSKLLSKTRAWRSSPIWHERSELFPVSLICYIYSTLVLKTFQDLETRNEVWLLRLCAHFKTTREPLCTTVGVGNISFHIQFVDCSKTTTRHSTRWGAVHTGETDFMKPVRDTGIIVHMYSAHWTTRFTSFMVDFNYDDAFVLLWWLQNKNKKGSVGWTRWSGIRNAAYVIAREHTSQTEGFFPMSKRYFYRLVGIVGARITEDTDLRLPLSAAERSLLTFPNNTIYGVYFQFHETR